MKFNCPYWSNRTKIELLQRWILVHSYLYYDLNYNIVSDDIFDKNCNQLFELQSKFPEDFKDSRYYYAMKEFDGSSGFGFVNKLNLEHYDVVTRDASILKDMFIGFEKDGRIGEYEGN